MSCLILSCAWITSPAAVGPGVVSHRYEGLIKTNVSSIILLPDNVSAAVHEDATQQGQNTRELRLLTQNTHINAPWCSPGYSAKDRKATLHNEQNVFISSNPESVAVELLVTAS